jgi:high mobility group protein B2
MSAYVLFGNELRKKILAENSKVPVTEVVKIIAYEWKLLSKKQKQKYRDLAKQDKQRYERELYQLTTLNSCRFTGLKSNLTTPT